MRAEHGAAPGGGPGGGSDQEDTGSRSSVPTGGDKTSELQLLGTMLRCQTPAEVQTIMFVVPFEAFADPLNAAVWRAAEALADSGGCDPVGVVQAVVAAGLWPRDLHHEVTVRVVDAIDGSRFDPHEWVTPAVEVLHAYARRTTASKLAQVARVLPSARLHDIARDLFAAAEFIQTVVYWIAHAERQEVQAA